MKTARRLARRASRAEHRLFLAEGPQAVREALRRPRLRARGVRGSRRGGRAPRPTRRRAGRRGRLAARRRRRRSASLSRDRVTRRAWSPSAASSTCPLADVLAAGAGLLAVCADVRDPGNAGTVIRCADAAGADGVVLTGDVGRPLQRQGGARLGRLAVPPARRVDPVRRTRSPRCAPPASPCSPPTARASSTSTTPLDDGLLAGPTAWLFGNEAWGLPDEIAALADHRVRIPIYGRAESLNLATAAAVCLYASARAQPLGQP